MAALLAEKTVLITGATSGIGLEAAVVLAQAGAKVVIVARDSAPQRRMNLSQRSPAVCSGRCLLEAISD